MSKKPRKSKRMRAIEADDRALVADAAKARVRAARAYSDAGMPLEAIVCCVPMLVSDAERAGEAVGSYLEETCANTGVAR